MRKIIGTVLMSFILVPTLPVGAQEYKIPKYKTNCKVLYGDVYHRVKTIPNDWSYQNGTWYDRKRNIAGYSDYFNSIVWNQPDCIPTYSATTFK